MGVSVSGTVCPHLSRIVQEVPGPSLREFPLLSGPLRREVAPPQPGLHRFPLPGRAAQEVEGGNLLHELVGIGPPPETAGVLTAGRGDAGDAGTEGAEFLPVDDDLDAVAALSRVLVPGRDEADRPEPGPRQPFGCKRFRQPVAIEPRRPEQLEWPSGAATFAQVR